MNSFKELIKPVTSSDFWSLYHEKKHVHIKSQNPTRFSDLISFEKLDEIIGIYGLTAPDISVVNSNKKISRNDYVWKKDMIDPARVASLFADGSTVIFNSLQDRVETLRELCAGISEDLQLKTQTNLYLTPPGSQGFNTHWDTHDVFVLQVEGHKHWKIYNESFPLPLEQEKHKFEVDCIQAENVIDEFILEQGDILYIPRGRMHSANASHEKSLHITLGVTAYTWKSFFCDYIESLSDKELGWRASIPLFSSDNEEVKSSFISKLKELHDSIDIESVMTKHLSSVSRSLRPRIPDLLSQSLNSSDLEKTDIIISHQYNDIKIIESEDNKKINLNTGFRNITFPISAKKTIGLIFDCNNKKIGEFNDDIDWESRKLVISKLIKEGLVFKLTNL